MSMAGAMGLAMLLAKAKVGGMQMVVAKEIVRVQDEYGNGKT